MDGETITNCELLRALARVRIALRRSVAGDVDSDTNFSYNGGGSILPVLSSAKGSKGIVEGSADAEIASGGYFALNGVEGSYPKYFADNKLDPTASR